jgi:pyrroline-5-carboxylate reductase
MTPGFIGTGTITSALVTGLCTSAHPPQSVWITPRNPQKAAYLAERFPPARIGASNQHVVDRADVVILAMLPRQAQEILKPLRFRADHAVVTLLAGTPLAQVRPLVAPAKRIFRAVPLPSAARHVGPIAVYPGDAATEDLFGELGTVIVAEEETELDKFLVITSLMAPYYALLHEIVSWAADAGVDRKNAADYTASMFQALSVLVTSRKDGDLTAMIQECMTPGGLNELALKVLKGRGGFDAVTPALRAVAERVLE